MFFSKKIKRHKKDSSIDHVKKINHLEKQLKKNNMELEKLFSEYSKNPQSPPITIEHVTIERLIVDKYEVSNYLGQLGIKELKGKLNIGATYGDGIPVQVNNVETTSSSLNQKVEDQPAKVNIQPRKN